MSNLDIIAIVTGLFIGYWIVSKALDHKAKQRDIHIQNATTPRWNEILGVPYTADEEEIRAAYKNLIKQYHPDKVSHLGDDIKSVAEAKTKEINKAFSEAIDAIRIFGKK